MPDCAYINYKRRLEKYKKNRVKRLRSKMTQNGCCHKNTPVNRCKKYYAKIAFWDQKTLESTPSYTFDEKSNTNVIPEFDPTTILEYTWNDPKECFVWIRRVSPDIGGGSRTNVATCFKICKKTNENNDQITTLTFVQNSNKCCKEFQTSGTVKTFNNLYLTIDESTCQTGNCLWVGLIDWTCK